MIFRLLRASFRAAPQKRRCRAQQVMSASDDAQTQKRCECAEASMLRGSAARCTRFCAITHRCTSAMLPALAAPCERCLTAISALKTPRRDARCARRTMFIRAMLLLGAAMLTCAAIMIDARRRRQLIGFPYAARVRRELRCSTFAAGCRHEITDTMRRYYCALRAALLRAFAALSRYRRCARPFSRCAVSHCSQPC